MAELVVRLLPWGNSYGLRIRKADAQRLGLRPGQELHCLLPDFTRPKDLSHWPKLAFKGRMDHNAGFESL